MSAPQFFTLDPNATRATLSSDLVMAGPIGFVSGVLPVDLANDRAALAEPVEGQTRQILANLETILRPHAMTRMHVVSVRVHVVQFERFHERVNTACAGFFAAGRQPARSLMGIDQLPRGALVSMDFIVSLY